MSMPGLTSDENTRLNALWKVADTAGLHKCSAAMESALMEYDAALGAKREAKAEADQAQADYDDALNMARTDISRRIVRETNKTYVPDGEGGERRQVTADEAKAWVERVAAAEPDVASTEKPLAAARMRLEEVTDRVAFSERRLQAVRYQTDSAVALTNLLSAAFKEQTR